MTKIEEFSKADFSLLVGGGVSFLLMIGCLYRLVFRKFLLSEIVLMQTNPLHWRWIYNSSFFTYLKGRIVTWILSSVIIFVLYRIYLFVLSLLAD